MIFYHGTVKKLLPQILKEGLKPLEEFSWKVADLYYGSLRAREPVAWVYLTPDLETAVDFAKGKVRYFAAKPGNPFLMEKFTRVITKDLHAPRFETSPAVLEVNLPFPMVRSLSRDPREDGSFRYPGVIQPQLISVIGVGS